MTNPYQTYYENQIGRGGLEVYRGTRYQRGAGIGGVLKGLLKLGLPIFKKAATTLGKHALSDGIRLSKAVANDVMHGKPIKQSLTLSNPGYFVSPACRGWYKKAHPYYFNN